MSNQFQQLVDRFWEKTLFKFIPLSITPNYFTCLRFLFIPVVLGFLATEHFFWALLFFFLASLTDNIDGSLARTRKQISEYGIMLDPLADKLLVILSVLFLLFYYPYFIILIAVVVIDILILLESVLLVLINHNIKTPPSDWTGKSKMIFQVIGLLAVFGYIISHSLLWLQFSLMFFYLVIFTGLMSLFSYGYKSLAMIKRKK